MDLEGGLSLKKHGLRKKGSLKLNSMTYRLTPGSNIISILKSQNSPSVS